MSRPISWLPQLGAIRRSVSNSVRSHYDRRDLELLFKLQTSAAGKLLDFLPAERIGSSHLVTRDALEGFLKQVAESDDVAGMIDRMKTEKAARSRRKIRGLKRYDLEPLSMTALPAWIKLSRGHMEVDFTTVEQLADGMYMLAGVLTHELAAFVEAYEPQQPPLFNPGDAADIKELFDELRTMEAGRKKG